MARLIKQHHLFIHCAKTGGTFFREVLNEFGIPNKEFGTKHCGTQDIKWGHTDLKDVGHIFGFIRNPVSWYRSRWAYAMMTYFPQKLTYMPDAQKHWMAKVWDDDINTFIHNTLKHYPNGIAWKYFNEMLNLEDNNIIKYKYENLVPFTRDFLKNIGDIRYNLVADKKILSSEKIGGEIAPSLVKEIERTEVRLLNAFYKDNDGKILS